ncbi:5-(carboxyamino)imidazole ribonucleotide synthase [Pontimonas sp.]|uniref:5-(carboxyamino)imidazole ribonucleotide synthase n=1 Tax=Pontimonas sp. TaxID=2304492 RepID=UPI00287045DF|nr:5-(carboxyamino)imidazole ribonucleotide synthase [Pontimonas sp.]MDR9396720.1 5-(carboxyamino)imidazole ribonucleotide synthase [Pontimonas sp.]MDR9435107.1 5-(carboxyamino)imidazole ribonucleotide synthase [Pontimonas sp.]
MTIRVGVVGGGQLARMMIPAAQALGVEIRVLAESDEASAGLAATVVGDYTDWETLSFFAQEVDVLTFDHEHVPTHLLERLVADGVVVRPGPHALVCAQDKSLMRERLAGLDVPLPAWAVAEDPGDVERFLAQHDGVAVAKTPRGGYDGKGVRVVSTPKDVDDWLASGPILLEQKVEFVRELAQLVARRPQGDSVSFPVVETLQKDGVCAEVVAPAPDQSSEIIAEAARIGRVIAEALDVTGVLAVEMFDTPSGQLLVNELAMRPHNSGHVFTEAGVTSQFEAHLRAVLDWPLGDTSLRQPWAVMVNLFGDAGNERIHAALDYSPQIRPHAYGKHPRPGRKAGHLVATGDDLEQLKTLVRGASEAGRQQ